MKHYLLAATALLALSSAPVSAQTVELSQPTWNPVTSELPAPRDVAFPGVVKVLADVSEPIQGIIHVEESIPVPPEAKAAGELIIYYPDWLPGHHAPRGEIEKVVNFYARAGRDDTPLVWRRDDVEMHAIRITLPEGGTDTVNLSFDFASATQSNQGRVVVTEQIANLRWMQLAFYPAGYYTRQIPIEASFILPDGWQAGTALKQSKASTGQNRIDLERTDYDTLVDSPIFAGEHYQRIPLTDNVAISVVTDEARYLAPTDEQIATHRKLVEEAKALYGVEHFDRYEFLLSMSDRLSGIGLEHHRSSENGVDPEYFTEWDKHLTDRDLLPHEYVHSWNGKFRRPEGLWSPDFQVQERGNLLWVYEGQTQFWGYVLAARSGMVPKEDVLGALARIADGMQERVGRKWRPLVDTTHDPRIKERRPMGWNSIQRNEDYYNEGLLIWLEADQIIRDKTGGKKSMDDFAKLFFGGKQGDWGVKTYNRGDVVAALKTVLPSYDWATFIQERVYEPTEHAPLAGIEMGGYKLVYGDEKSKFFREYETNGKYRDHSAGIGLAMKDSGDISSVQWGSAAFDAGLTSADKIISINNRDYSNDELENVIKLAQKGEATIDLIVSRRDQTRPVTIDYTGGLRYPMLVKVGKGETGLDRLLAPKTK